MRYMIIALLASCGPCIACGSGPDYITIQGFPVYGLDFDRTHVEVAIDVVLSYAPPPVVWRDTPGIRWHTEMLEYEGAAANGTYDPGGDMDLWTGVHRCIGFTALAHEMAHWLSRGRSGDSDHDHLDPVYWDTGGLVDLAGRNLRAHCVCDKTTCRDVF